MLSLNASLQVQSLRSMSATVKVANTGGWHVRIVNVWHHNRTIGLSYPLQQVWLMNHNQPRGKFAEALRRRVVGLE